MGGCSNGCRDRCRRDPAAPVNHDLRIFALSALRAGRAGSSRWYVRRPPARRSDFHGCHGRHFFLPVASFLSRNVTRLLAWWPWATGLLNIADSSSMPSTPCLTVSPFRHFAAMSEADLRPILARVNRPRTTDHSRAKDVQGRPVLPHRIDVIAMLASCEGGRHSRTSTSVTWRANFATPFDNPT